MAYWITLRKGLMRNGFQAATAREALNVLLTSKRDGYENVRVIHTGGYEVTEHMLALSAEGEAPIQTSIDHASIREPASAWGARLFDALAERS